MADDRTLLQKLEAMAEQVSQSPNEAAIAARIVEKTRRSSAPETESTRVLTREAILGTPDRDSSGSPGGTVSVRINGTWVVLDKDEATLIRNIYPGWVVP